MRLASACLDGIRLKRRRFGLSAAPKHRHHVQCPLSSCVVRRSSHSASILFLVRGSEIHAYEQKLNKFISFGPFSGMGDFFPEVPAPGRLWTGAGAQPAPLRAGTSWLTKVTNGRVVDRCLGK